MNLTPIQGPYIIKLTPHTVPLCSPNPHTEPLY